MNTSSTIAAFAFCAASFGCGAAHAQAVDPEAYIAAHGYQTKRLGDDGKMIFYSFTDRTTKVAVGQREREVASLPKDERILQVCDFMRGGVKAMLIEASGKAIDVAVSNYGYSGSTIVCVLKYMAGSEVGTQVLYQKAAKGSMYTYAVTH